MGKDGSSNLGRKSYGTALRPPLAPPPLAPQTIAQGDSGFGAAALVTTLQ